MADKVIVSNRSALTAKYQPAGFNSLQTALQALIAADAKRGLTTKCIYVDDATDMKGVGGTPPVNASDERGNKLAIDAIANSLSPDYIVLLDGPDVIPHIVLDNPTPNDGDTDVPSDLPYASPNGYVRQVARFLKITRVVGRIPNVRGAKDPSRIVSFLKTATDAAAQDKSKYDDYYGLSADVWLASTQMSLRAAFGNSTNLGIAPPAGPPTNDGDLSKLSHFINCHGAQLSAEFYGQSGTSYPVALTSDQVGKNAVGGAVVAAECCYGAQLYDPILSGISDPICVSYLKKGALGFLGSTNIAYGPSASNGQADLMTQYFFEFVLKGASLGRALLQARQQFLASQKMTNPMNLKTLAQFLLLGDPSVCPCIPPAELSAMHGITELAEADDGGAERKSRRVELAGFGISIADGKAVPGGPGEVSDALKARIRDIAAERGYTDTKEAIFAVKGAKDYRAAMKAQNVEESVMIISEQLKAPHPILAYRHLVAHILDDKVSGFEESVSR
jgi:hypothetical protein